MGGIKVESKLKFNSGTLKVPLIIWSFFILVAITMAVVDGELFYLFNFLYIGTSVALGIFLVSALPSHKKHYARHIVQLLVGGYMLGYLGLIEKENMQIEGFWIYLLEGAFSGATLHYLIAKVGGPLLFGRAWCGWTCWTAMVLDFLPHKKPENNRINRLGLLRYFHFFATIIFIMIMYRLFTAEKITISQNWELQWLIIGNIVYYILGIILAIVLKDNRAFCKYICPIPVFMKPGARAAVIRMSINKDICTNCKLCEKNCLMNVPLLSYKDQGNRISSTECILCSQCANVCPASAITISAGFGDRYEKIKNQS